MHFFDRNIRNPFCSDSQKDRDPQGGASGGLGLSGAVGGRLGPPGALKDPQGNIFFLISSCLGPSGAVWGPLGPAGAARGGPKEKEKFLFLNQLKMPVCDLELSGPLWGLLGPAGAARDGPKEKEKCLFLIDRGAGGPTDRPTGSPRGAAPQAQGKENAAF